MRAEQRGRWRHLLRHALAAAVLLAGGSADAGVLTAATWTQTVSAPGGLGVALTRTGLQLDLIDFNNVSTETSLTLTLDFPDFVTSFFVPNTNFPLPRHFRLTQGGPQQITATPGMGNGVPGIPGTVVVMTASHGAMGVNQSMFKVGVNTLVQVPLSNGKAGQFTNTFQVFGAIGALTVNFHAWTPGTLTFTGLTTKGMALPDVVAMGSWNLTSKGGGTVTLVSPSKLSANCSLLTTRSVLSLSTLRLTFIPEPTALLLLASAAVVVAGAARRRA